MTTKSHIVCKAMQTLDIDTQEEVLLWNGQDEEMHEKLHKVTSKILRFFWKQVPITDILVAKETNVKGDTTTYCPCREQYST